MCDGAAGFEPEVAHVRVRIENGALQLAEGPSMRLREGWAGDLCLPRAALLTTEERERIRWNGVREVLPVGTVLFVHVRKADRADGLVQLSPEKVDARQPEAFVELTLLEPLEMDYRPRRKARLCVCVCEISALNERAMSINQAYTKVSEAYEGWRRSHTGNVFKEVFFRSETSDGTTLWRPLEALRKA